MNLLVLDTSTPRAAIALVTAGGGIRTMTTDPAERHGRALVPAIRDLLEQAGLTVAGVDGFVVGLGPGSYTGLRIGITAAKTFAFALGKPLAAFDSLEAIGRNAPGDARRIAVIADAQRGDVYAADFRREVADGPLERVEPTRIESLAGWAERLPGGALVLGPGAILERIAPSIPSRATLPSDPSRHWPDPRAMAALAVEVWRSGRREEPFLLEPAYLRRSAAEEQWSGKGSGG